ncbi:MAG: DNA-binding response regulator [Bacteroidota bacterium]|jgi:DNA-binding NarL/FixJ family response regulator
MEKIAFVEDHRGFFTRLENLFKTHQIDAKGWYDFTNLEQNLLEYQPQIILLDISIGDNKDAGMDALKLIRKKDQFRKMKIIMLTDDPTKIQEAFRLRADGYLCKEDIQRNMELLQDLMKEHPISPKAAKKLIRDYQDCKPNMNLTPREESVLALASQDKSNPEIAAVLDLKPFTVESYMKTIRFKLECHTVQGAVAKAIRCQLID